MPEMLSNTSCLIALDNIGELELLHRLYGIVHISEEVAAEFGVAIPAWITVHPVQDKAKLDILHNLVDLGEACTIALAYQLGYVTMILDDRKARKLADNLNLRFTGLLGILIKAKQSGVIHSVGNAGCHEVCIAVSSTLMREGRRTAKPRNPGRIHSKGSSFSQTSRSSSGWAWALGCRPSACISAASPPTPSSRKGT